MPYTRKKRCPSLTSVELVSGRSTAWPKKMYRKDVPIGHVYSVKGSSRLLLDTGKRTMPPSGAVIEISVNGKRTKVNVFEPHEILDNGDYVIGYQSIVVSGDVKECSDGAVYGTNPTASVTCHGPANIVLPE